jgi:hypothetical protein
MTEAMDDMEVDAVMEAPTKRIRVKGQEVVKIEVWCDTPDDPIGSFTVPLNIDLLTLITTIRETIQWPEMPANLLLNDGVSFDKIGNPGQLKAEDDKDEDGLRVICFMLVGFLIGCRLCGEKFLLPYEDDDDDEDEDGDQYYGDDGNPVHRCFACRAPKIEADL